MRNINNIEIDKNSICYGDEVLKISNISRMYIFRFQNVKKKEYDREKQRYEDLKRYYEVREHNKKKLEIRNYSIACILIGIFSFCVLETTPWGLAVLGGSIICGLMAIKTYRRKIKYDQEPPEEKFFPEKFGLGIQMNSGYYAVFAAEGTEGRDALRKLQEDIKNADVHNEKTVFNMNKYNVQVEGDIDGIVNLGNDNINVNKGKDLQMV